MRSRSGWAAAMPRRESTTTVDGSLMIFFIAAPPVAESAGETRSLLSTPRRRSDSPGSTSVTQAYEPQQLAHGAAAPHERHRPQQRTEPLPGHGLGPGELAQAVLAVDPAEAGLARPAERQRRHRGI